jgi:hypothetical protein
MDEDCCRISHLFIKAPFIGFPVVGNPVIMPFHYVEFSDFGIFRSQPVMDSKASLIHFTDPSPPPLSGNTLVYYLHQIRIPAPVC